MKDFHPGVAVVTGAGSGIGRGTAKALAAHGAELIVADIDRAAADDAVAELRDLGSKATAYELDVADTAALEEFAETVRTAHGVPDVVVNNAGIVVGGPFLDVPVEDLERIIDINLMAMIHGCRIFGQQMVARGTGGHLVNISSMAAFAPAPYGWPYSISKYAVKHFSECLRAELAPHGIGVTVICPGLIATNLTATARMASLTDRQADIGRRLALAGQALFGADPDGAGRTIVRAIRKNIAVEPIRPEARISYPLARLFPGVVRAGMILASDRRVERLVRRVIDDPRTVHLATTLADRLPLGTAISTPESASRTASV
ncbi:SDR family NAD(P)-dependent oxidoreductase [Nocardia mexicana]|uniref:Short-subunit dehydrogenase n=1 Tax=Nocardia mexicana TaxID=279262 RepID=A0A370GFQ7_9NOCA|nr:SDR family NAD(P)-dependent oxidoreductase [Nocardia mexicana]RDI42642.1 short-subunit dehydrogenase [Nocardia mexicana]